MVPASPVENSAAVYRRGKSYLFPEIDRSCTKHFPLLPNDLSLQFNETTTSSSASSVIQDQEEKG